MNKKTDFNWWCDRAWIYAGSIISGIMTILLLLNWNTWSNGLKVVACVAIFIPIHVLEEWVFPGGFHYQYNVTMFKSDTPNCYPMNRASDMYTNLVTTIMCACLVFFCMANDNYVYPGMVMGSTIFCCLELFGHTMMGTKMHLAFKDKGKKTIYGPGSITTYWGFVPLGVIGAYSLQELTMDTLNWIIAIAFIGYIAIFCILIPEGILKRKDTPYKFESYGYYERFLK